MWKENWCLVLNGKSRYRVLSTTLGKQYDYIVMPQPLIPIGKVFVDFTTLGNLFTTGTDA